jgi:hypothetical protein
MPLVQLNAGTPITQAAQTIPAVVFGQMWLKSLVADFSTVGGDGTVTAILQQYGLDANGNAVVAPNVPAQTVQVTNAIAASQNNPALLAALNAVMSAVAALANLTTTTP